MDLQNMQGQKEKKRKQNQIKAHSWVWCIPVSVLHTCGCGGTSVGVVAHL